MTCRPTAQMLAAWCQAKSLEQRARDEWRTYMPYRGIGHYELGMALRNGKRPRCVMTNHPEVSFAVLSCPEYGILEFSKFSASRGVV